MKKQLIYFNECGYNTAKKTLNNLAERINSQMEVLTKNDTITIEYLYDLLDNYEFISKDKYREKLKEIADRLMIPYEMIRFPEHEQIIKSTKYSIQYLYEVKEKIGSSGKEYLRMNLLYLKDNKVFISDDAEEKLKELFSYYAETDKEKKAFDIIQDIISNLNELKEMTRARPAEIEKLYYFDNSDYKKYKINIKNFKQISK